MGAVRHENGIHFTKSDFDLIPKRNERKPKFNFNRSGQVHSIYYYSSTARAECNFIFIQGQPGRFMHICQRLVCFYSTEHKSWKQTHLITSGKNITMIYSAPFSTFSASFGASSFSLSFWKRIVRIYTFVGGKNAKM